MNVHLIWDESPLSLLNLCTILSLIEHNPDANIMVHRMGGTLSRTWKSKEHSIQYIGKDYWGCIPKNVEIKNLNVEIGANSVHKSDIARIWLLYQYGGYYSDFDIVFIKPLPVFDANFAIAYQGLGGNNSYFPFGFMYATVGSRSLLHVSNYSQKNTADYQAYGVELLRLIFQADNLSLIEASDFISNITKEEVVCFSPRVYMPYSDLGNELFFVGKKLPQFEDQTVGVHWFNGDPRAKLYQNLMAKGIAPDCPLKEVILRYL